MLLILPTHKDAAGNLGRFNELSSAIFEWIEAWYNPRRRHTSLGDLSPADYENLHNTAAPAA